MNSTDKQYLDLLKYILENGTKKADRTGTGTLSIFDYTMRFNMSEGFPLLTSKKMFTKGIIHELIWFLRGDTNIKYLLDNDVHIWDGDVYGKYCKSFESPVSKDLFIDRVKLDDVFNKEWGDLGPVYGKQWRNWGGYNDREIQRKRDKRVSYDEYVDVQVKGIDQISNLISDLKKNPDSRRLMVNAWNVEEIEDMTLPPCHYGFQCYTQEIYTFERKKIWSDSLNKHGSYAEDIDESELDTLKVPKRKLSLKWTQRSCDVGLGIPYNISSYAILLHLLAREVNMIPNELIFSGGDCHIYLNHIDAVKEQIKNETFTLPKLVLTNESIDDLKYEDIKIIGYKSSESIKMKLSN
jgi:thymidylate synthase